jgi:geranylgeranyl diphosphate synthase type II
VAGAPLTIRAADVEAALAQYRSVTARALVEYLPSREPRRHLYDLLPVYPLRPGKALRPALCIATCGAFGGPPEAAEKTAVAIELLHNAFLVHDDIEDQSARRRGEPTLHCEQGMAIALNVGDALAMLSLRPLFDNFVVIADLAWDVLAEFSVMVQETLEGQAMDLGWVRDNIAVSYEDYLVMTLKKTSWYTTISPCRLGALIGSKGRADVDGIVPFGFYLGAAFQISDDLLAFTAHDGEAGKSQDDDLYEAKRTVMLIHLVEQLKRESSPDLERLDAFLGLPRAEREPGEVSWVRKLMDYHGSVEFGRACLREMTTMALAEFETGFGHLPDSAHKRFIGDLPLYLLHRVR